MARTLLLAVLALLAPAAFAADTTEMDAPSEVMAKAAPMASLRDVQPAMALPIVMVARAEQKRVIDRNFLVLAGVATALTVVDVELTQHCIAARTCREANPTLPQSRAGQYAVNAAVNSAILYVSYRMKKTGRSKWWLGPVIIAVPHAVGTGANMRFIGK